MTRVICVLLSLASCQACVHNSADRVFYKLREQYSDMGFYRINGSIYLVSDISPEQVDSLSRKVRSFVGALKSGFGITSAMAPVTILAFKSPEGYNDYLERYQKRHTHAQYGFYAPGERQITVNFGAGDGTISHELVHAVVDSDNKDAPLWFSEGLASLYEECEVSPEGRIKGRVNWRFYKVKNPAYIKENLIYWLVMLNADKFYNEDPEKAYAVARLFCFYLQEHGMLVPLYGALKQGGRDPTGISALRGVSNLSIADIDAAFKQWASRLLAD